MYKNTGREVELPGNDGEKRIAVTLTGAQAERLKVLGARVDLSTGLLARALVEYALPLAEADDPGVRAAIQAVRDADRARRRAVGSRVIAARYPDAHTRKKKGNPE